MKKLEKIKVVFQYFEDEEYVIQCCDCAFNGSCPDYVADSCGVGAYKIVEVITEEDV